MKIEAIDFFYLSMPTVLDIGDGSQDALLVHLCGGNAEGWGECEAAPLVSIAGLVCPMSHSACKAVQDSVLGQRLETAEDIARISHLVRKNSRDLLQTGHILSGIEMAMWDLLGREFNQPAYELLGYSRAFPKTAYASQLFGDDAHSTWEKAQESVKAGFRAVKFGWGPFGKGSLKDDRDQLRAAWEGLGKEVTFLVDAGAVWGEKVDEAEKRLEMLVECGVTWLEEPFPSEALDAYKRLSQKCNGIQLAGGEDAHNFYMAKNLIDYGGIGYVQIDAGRVGGLGPARQVAEYADSKDVTYVNHTFTSYLALSASLQPYAGLEGHSLCEYPVEARPLARELTHEKLDPDVNGQLHLPDGPGLGMTPNPSAITKYLADVEITVNGRVIYRTPSPEGASKKIDSHTVRPVAPPPP